MQELLSLCRGQLLREDLQTITIRVEEIDALGEDMVNGEFYPGAVAFEPVIEFAKLLLPPFDL
jgi:hypothetical protein